MRSQVMILSMEDGKRRVVFESVRFVEAPNWSPDGKYLLVNCQGELWRVPLEDPRPRVIALPSLRGINNDHGISPDGRSVAVSEVGGPVYVVDLENGTARRVSEHSPAYYHGWSPDGGTIAYVAKDAGGCHIYTVRVDGSGTRQLTARACHDDGPDFSADGKWIYFNSNREGVGDIWRIPADGPAPADAVAERLTDGERVDWFAHPSPDGRWVVFLSYPAGTVGHPPDREVLLRVMETPEQRAQVAKPRELVRLFGGQGTINVNSWSPDGKQLAYVSFTPLTAP